MIDLIKREDAIRALKREKSDWNYDYNVPIDNCIKRLSKVKSADTEIEIIKAEAFAKGIDSERKRISDWCRPSGEWIETKIYRGNGDAKVAVMCPECKRIPMWLGSPILPTNSGNLDFCPHCGCRMKGADDE